MDRVTHPTPSRMHELVTAGGQGVTHDTQGNMLLIPTCVRANSSPLVLTWDFDNRMVSADVGADSVIDVTHQYDALGRRVARTASGSTTVFVQVDQQTICDYASGAAPASSTYRYLYGSYIDEPIVRIATSNSDTTWYHRNQQYSIVASTDSTGAATERYAYTAYGLPTITDGSGTVRTSSAIGNRYTYTGREWDGVLGLYHYRARMYEATVGRFCSRDPIGIYGGLNYYRYARCRPLASVDPSGMFDKKQRCEDFVSAQSKTLNKKLKEQYKKCRTWEDTEVVCEDCKGSGNTGCETKNKIKITICYTSLADNEGGARAQLNQRLDHEYQHATDICNCNSGCSLLQPPTWSWYWRGFCQGIACLEIRAYSVDGGCNHLQGEERK